MSSRIGNSLIVALVLVAYAGCGGSRQPEAPAPGHAACVAPPAASAPATDWTRFGFDPQRSNDARVGSTMSADTVRGLRRQEVRLPGTADSSPIFLAGVRAGGRRCDLFIVTTSYGRTLAIDAHSGRRVWTFTPPGIDGWEGSSQITNASPVASADRRFVFATSPDGRLHKLAVADGREASAGDWPAKLTEDPGHEKLPAALNLDRGRVIATTGGYLGDAPPYQGHVVTVDAGSGAIVGVFNALCADRHEIEQPPSCPESGAAIWGRSGAVVEPGTGRLLVTTGDGAFDGRRYFGDTVLVLSPDGKELLGSYTPPTARELEEGDIDLGSTAPALLPGGLAVQSGKDGVVRLLDLRQLRRGELNGPAEIQQLPAPDSLAVFTAPAVLRGQGGDALVVIANGAGTTAYRLSGRRLSVAWENGHGGTSPVAAAGLLWVYDAEGGVLRVYEPRTGRPVAELPCGRGHWNSPIVGGGVVALPEGSANDHLTTGVLNLYRPG